jgi:hypothetical protein
VFACKDVSGISQANSIGRFGDSFLAAVAFDIHVQKKKLEGLLGVLNFKYEEAAAEKIRKAHRMGLEFLKEIASRVRKPVNQKK